MHTADRICTDINCYDTIITWVKLGMYSHALIIFHHAVWCWYLPRFSRHCKEQRKWIYIISLLRSAVGKTHYLRSDLWWTIPLDILLDRFRIPLGLYSEIDHIHLSSEAQCVSHHLPQVDCHNHEEVLHYRPWVLNQPRAPLYLDIFIGSTFPAKM